MSTANSNQKSVLYIVSRAPYSNANGQEALDALLVGTSFDLNVSVLFIHDGVFQLKEGQGLQEGQGLHLSGLKTFTKAYKALSDFGVENVYIHDASLAARGLTDNELTCDTVSLDSSGVRDLIAGQAKVFTF